MPGVLAHRPILIAPNEACRDNLITSRKHLWKQGTQMNILIDGSPCEARAGELLLEAIVRTGTELPHVCYHPQLGAIQSCDTCLVESNGELVRACGTRVAQEMSIRTGTERARSARTEAFDRIL